MSDEHPLAGEHAARTMRDAWVAANQATIMAGMRRDAMAAGAEGGASIDAEDAHNLAVALAQLAMLTPDTALDHTLGVGPALVLDPPPVAVARALAVVQFLDKVITAAIRQHAEDVPHLYPDGSR